MGVYDELSARGLIAQATNLEKTAEILNNGKVVFYVGFDPTADSLHVGSFVQMIVMAHMQRAGHVPIVLFGGGTALIGDPTGKTDMRRMLTREAIDNNIACFKRQMEKFIDFSNGKAFMVNNADWLLNLNYVEFLRDIGVHFSVNRMLSAECYKQRLVNGLSFFELNYMIMQSYDFLLLNNKYNCTLQMGGDDQWSNIIGGVELVRRKKAEEVYGLTFNLLATADGKKMGKTENGTIWLDPDKTSPYDFYQYFRNVADDDVIKCLKMLTFLPMDQINELAKLQGNQLNHAKELLAFNLTELVHGSDEAQKVHDAAKAVFCGGQNLDNVPSTMVDNALFADGSMAVVDLLTATALAGSKGDARRLIEQGGISVILKDDTRKISHVTDSVNVCDFHDGFIMLKKGKKIYHKVILS